MNLTIPLLLSTVVVLAILFSSYKPQTTNNEKPEAGNLPANPMKKIKDKLQPKSQSKPAVTKPGPSSHLSKQPSEENSTKEEKMPEAPAPPLPSDDESEEEIDCGLPPEKYGRYEQKMDEYMGKERNVRLFGSGGALQHSWPWHVHLERVLHDGTSTHCMATVIPVKNNKKQSNILLTSAHCVAFYDHVTRKPKVHPELQKVHAGKHEFYKYENPQQAAKWEAAYQYREGDKPRWHRAWDGKDLYRNNIALLRLKKPLDFTDTVRPICLPEVGLPVVDGQICVMTGWGASEGSDKITSWLQQADMEVHDSGICGDKDKWGAIYDRSTMICAGDFEGLKRPCQYDNGGPLACMPREGRNTGKFTVSGVIVTKDVKECPKLGKPALFLSAIHFAKWIKDNADDFTNL